MDWESMYGNLDHYEARLREFEQERLAHRIWLATHPLPRLARRMRTRLGQWLVVWGLALQARTDTPFGQVTATQPK